MKNMTRLVSLIVVALLIVVLGATFYRVIAPFLLPLFLAGVIAMLVEPLQGYYERKMPGRNRVAAGLTTGTVVLGISIPVIVIVLMATFQVVVFVSDVLQEDKVNQFTTSVRDRLDIDRMTNALHPFVSAEMTKEELKDRLSRLPAELQNNVQTGLQILVENTIGLANRAVGLLGSLAALTVQLLMLVIALYYFLADGPGLVETSERLIPISVEYQRELRTRFNTVVRAVVSATFFSAIAQGIATALMLCFYYGFGHFVILFILATFASMVPLFGTWLVWGPCVIWLLLHGAWVPALLFLVIGVVVIGSMDNIIRTYVLQSDAQLHPLLAFVSVLGGVQVMGLWGVFIAPIVASILHALVVIFNTEISVLSKERLADKLQDPPEFAPPEAPTPLPPEPPASPPPQSPLSEQAPENA
jgi:predicted PurR-regulated permease PerM